MLQMVKKHYTLAVDYWSFRLSDRSSHYGESVSGYIVM